MTLAWASASRTMVGASETVPSAAPAVLRNVRRSARIATSGRRVGRRAYVGVRAPDSSPPRFRVSRPRAHLARPGSPVYSARAMDLVAVLTLEILNGIATLVLISLGLAIIFGMMRVINLAHGEFL